MTRVRGRWILLAGAMVAIGLLVWKFWPGASGAPAALGARHIERVVPDSARIKIEVLNGTNVRGLARRGTFVLRDLGFDVVSSGNSSEKVDSTVVIVRSGRMDWAELAAKALGGARIESRPDSSRYLDLTIVLGSSWRPPAETFYP